MTKRIIVIGRIGADALTVEVDPALEIARIMGWPEPAPTPSR